MTNEKTMTAEEVNEAVGEIRSQMEIAFDITGTSEAALSYLSRLAAQAARVPGLVETLEELAHLMECEATGPALLVRMRAEKQACSDFEARMLNAESERDAAQKEAASAFACCGGNDAPEGRREHTQDCNRREAEGLRLGQENATLRERVATLEKEVRAERDHGLCEREDIEADRDAETSRADTAEAHLAAVNEALDDLGYTVTREIGALQSKVQEMAEGCGVAHTSHPAPTTGVVGTLNAANVREVLMSHWDSARETSEVENEPGSARAREVEVSIQEVLEIVALELDLAPIGDQSPSKVLAPTPPPGLLEAVGKAVAAWGDAGENGGKDAMDALDGAMADLRAAYDATGGEESAPVSVQGDFDAVKAAMGAHPRHGKAALMRLAKDAAKYRAAVEMAKDAVALGKAAYEGQSGTPEAEWMVPWEQFDELDREMHTRQGVAVAQRLLGLTLATPPSGPGGGEEIRVSAQDAERIEADLTIPNPERVKRLSALRERVRARQQTSTTPTPTPEVPPLKPMEYVVLDEQVGEDAPPNGWCEEHDWDTADGDLTDGAKCRACPAVAHEAGRMTLFDGRAEPQPTAPGVVWEGDGVRVVKHPDAGDFTVSYSHAMGPIGALGVLARALAEAKREVAEMRKAHEAVQYAARNVSWAKAGGEVVAMHSERLRDGAEKAAREAAESMRERAAAEAMMVWQCGGIPAVRDSASAIARAIRALPLE